MARSVNEQTNNLTREVLELLAASEEVTAVNGVYIYSDEETLFTGFRKNGVDGGGGDAVVLVLNLQTLQDEIDQLPRPFAARGWCAIS